MFTFFESPCYSLLLKRFFRITPSLFPKREFFSNPSVSLSKGSSTFSPSPSSSGSGDVAGDAIALPEFWYRKRSLCPKGLAMIAYATELRLFVRCYTALVGSGAYVRCYSIYDDYYFYRR